MSEMDDSRSSPNAPLLPGEPSTAAHLDSAGIDAGYEAGDLDELLDYLPAWLQEAVEGLDGVLEVRFAVGRRPTVKHEGGFVVLEQRASKQDVQHVTYKVGAFNANERAGVGGTLHRIAPVRDDDKSIIGVNIRVGRHVLGVAEPLRQVLLETSESLLVLGPPGAGKTTLLRDIARILAHQEALASDVVIVDASSEIGGAGRVPHPCIEEAVRLQVPYDMTQADVLLQALRNHGPSVIIADEIGYASDADVIKTIAQRGVRVIATGHGRNLEEVMDNEHLLPLIGTPERHLGRRRYRPVFNHALEIRGHGQLHLHSDVAKSVDALLAGRTTPALALAGN